MREYGLATMNNTNPKSLDSQAARFLEASIGWEGMLTARLISNTDLTNMRRMSGRSVKEVAAGMAIMASDGNGSSGMDGAKRSEGGAFCATMLNVLKYV